MKTFCKLTAQSPAASYVPLPRFLLQDEALRDISNDAKVLYALLLLCGMFTAALSSLFGITSRLEVRLGGRLSRRFLALLCALAFVGSIFGFKNVVSYVYPLCGYVGFFALIGVALHFRFLHKTSAAENAPTP